MKVRCKLSGVELFIQNGSVSTDKTNCFLDLHIQDQIHPIFNASVEVLLSQLPKWSSGQLNEVEAKLLFLALIYKTDLVQWSVPANPSPRTVATHMVALAKFVRGFTASTEFNELVPRLTIRKETASLSNIGAWIEGWFNAKKNAIDFRTSHRLKLIEARLEQHILSPAKDTESYAAMLWNWVKVAAKVPAAKHEEWAEIFALKIDEQKIFKINGNAIRQCLGFMETHLDHLEHGLLAAAVLKHLRKILDRNERGLFYNLGLTDDNIGYTLIVEDLEKENVLRIAATAPTEEPKKENYKTYFEYLRAKAAYQVAQGQLEKQQKIEVTLLKKEKKETLEAIDAAEAVQFSSIEEQEAVEELLGIKKDDLKEME